MSPHQQQYYQHVLATLNQVFLTRALKLSRRRRCLPSASKPTALFTALAPATRLPPRLSCPVVRAAWSIPKPLTSSMGQPAGLIR